MVVLHTAIAIVLVIVLIIRFKVDPVISLVLSSLYLGLATGVGFTGTITAITGGFGSIMAEVGLLIGFGVLIGSLLHSLGTFRKLVGGLLRVVGSRRLPYAMTAALSTVFPSIYVDVQVVLAAPIARSSGPRIGGTRSGPDGRRDRHRDLRRLRSRHPGSGRSLHRRAAQRPPRHVVAVRHRPRAVDRHRYHDHLLDDMVRTPVLEPRQRRGSGGGLGRLVRGRRHRGRRGGHRPG